jgi:outer membrane murein-binding lipoprotein Lpp
MGQNGRTDPEGTTMRRTLSILVVVLATMLLAGCATKTRSDALMTTLKAYGSTLRWGDFQSAAQFIDPAVRAAHPLTTLQLARYRQVRVSEYDDGPGPVPVGDFEVRQTAQISLINVHTQSERSIVDQQTWRYDENAKRWWLISGLPDITQD